MSKKQEREDRVSVNKVDIRDEIANSFAAYAKDVIMDRALPDIRDGLLPVQRRIIYGMHKMRLLPTNKQVKSARIVGEVMGKYHPHGDCINPETLLYLDTGETRKIGDLYEETQAEPGKTYGIYAVNEEGQIVRATLSDVRIGQYADEIYHITLSNGYTLSVTANHPFLAYNQEWVKAEDLTINTPLFNARLLDDEGYPTIHSYSKEVKKSNTLLRLVKEEIAENKEDLELNGHHVNENPYDNSRSNIELLTDEEHARVHGGNIHTLIKGHETMFSGNNEAYREATRLKNKNLMASYNQQQYLHKALIIIGLIEDDGLEVNNENYNKYRGKVYNGTTIQRLKERGKINEDVKELLGVKLEIDTESAKGHTKELQDKKRLEKYKKEKLRRVKRYLKGNHNMYKATIDTVISLIEQGKELNQENYEQERVGSIKNKSNIERTVILDNIHEYLQHTNYEGILYVTDIQVEQVNKQPMYDFTVDGVANALFVASEDNKTFVSLHNSALYGAMARMSKEWVLRNPLVTMFGNNGSVDGDTPAAMRYTEARLSKPALKLLEGLNKQGVVDWQKNYDDALDEPQYLPAQFPNILVNGASGISVGYASDIPPHNLKEVLEACIQVLDDPTLTFEQLAIQGPDFPTGGEIINKNELGRIYDVGEGSIRVRAKYYLEETSKRSKYNKLVFYEMPYDVKKPDIVLQIKKLLDQKLLNGVNSVMDDSNKEGIRLVLQVEKGVNHESLADVLYQKTNLQANVTYNCVVISDGKPRVLGINELLRRYNKFRVETVRRELEADNEVDRKRLHILDGLLVLADNVKDIIALIEQSKTKNESRQALIGGYNLSVEQANTILELQLHRINQASKEDFLAEHNERTAQLAHRQNILNTKSLLIQYVKDGYAQLIEEFKADTKRLTSVTSEEVKVNVDIESMIQHEEVAVGVTPDGYIKRSSIRSYQSTESEYTGFSIETDTHQHILIFTNKGNYVYLPVHEIKEGRWGDEGGHLSTIGVEFTEGEKIVSLAEYDEEATVFILRKSGSGKTSLASDFPVSRHTSLYTCGGVDEGDEVIMAGLVAEGDTLAIKTEQVLKTKTKKGVFILNVQDLRTIGVKAKGRKIVKLPKTKNIIDCITVESTGEETSFNKGTNEMEVTPVLPLIQYNQAPFTFTSEQLLVEPEVDEEQTDDSIVEEV